LISVGTPVGIAATTVGFAILKQKHARLLTLSEPWLRNAAGAGVLLCIGSTISLNSLTYIDYRTRLIIRSCKPVVTAGIQQMVGKSVRPSTWIAAWGTSIAAGIYIAAPVDHEGDVGGMEHRFIFFGIMLVIAAMFMDVCASIMEHSIMAAKTNALEVAAVVNLIRTMIGGPMLIMADMTPCSESFPGIGIAISSLTGAAAQIAMLESLEAVGPVNQTLLAAFKKMGTLAISSLRYGPPITVIQCAAGTFATGWTAVSKPLSRALGFEKKRQEEVQYSRVPV
jgi:drug/metabolite transporter (DMT)-like permease